MADALTDELDRATTADPPDPAPPAPQPQPQPQPQPIPIDNARDYNPKTPAPAAVPADNARDYDLDADRLKVAVSTGLESDPKRSARLLAAQERTGLPTQLIDPHLDEVEQALRVQDFDADKFRRESPLVARALADYPALAGLTRDDLPQLANLERLIRSDARYSYLPNGSIIEDFSGGNLGSVYPSVVDFRNHLIAQGIAADEVQRRVQAISDSFGPTQALAAGFTSSIAATMHALGNRRFDEGAQVLGEASIATNPGLWGSVLRGAGGFAADLPTLLIPGSVLARAVSKLPEAVAARALLGERYRLAGGLEDALKAAEGGDTALATAIAQAHLATKAVSGLAESYQLSTFAEHILTGAASMQGFALRDAAIHAQDGDYGKALAAWAADTGIAGLFGPVGASRFFMRQAGEQAPSAAALSASGLLLKHVGLNAGQNATFTLADAIQRYASGEDPHALDGTTLGPQLAASGALGAIMGAAFTAPEAWAHVKRMRELAGNESYQRIAAMATAQRLGEIAKQGDDMHALELNQPAVQSLVKQLAENGSDIRRLYLDAQAVRDHFAPKPGTEEPKAGEPAPESARDWVGKLTGDPKAFDRVIASGQQIEVPIENFFGHVVRSEHRDWFLSEARRMPGAMNDREAMAAWKADAERLSAQAKGEINTTPAGVDPIRQSADLVAKDVEQKIQEADPRVTPSEARRNGEIWGAFYHTIAHRFKAAGVPLDPWTLYQGKPLTVRKGSDDEAQRPASDGQLEQPVSTRVPSSVRPKENPLAQMLLVGLDAAKQHPKSFKKNAELVAGYHHLPKLAGRTTPDQKAEHFIEHAKSNLLFLHDAVAPATRSRSKLWYDGARAIVDRWVQRFNLPDRTISGVLAVLSPQKDWFKNVSLAERVLDIITTKQAHRWDDAMGETAKRIYAKPDFKPMLAEIQGKTLGELSDPVERAAWLRAYDEAHNPQHHRVVTPEGDFAEYRMTKTGERAGTGWGSLAEIAKAISIIEDPRIENISAQLGSEHKVRNFYNNIYDPKDPAGHVTIDTHAVAASLMSPLSGASEEVVHNFGGRGSAASAELGMSGTYGLHAEAYRRAAAERGVLPREMQSITWEAIRGLFPPSFKAQARNVEAVERIWKAYAKGHLTLSEARRQVIDLAGGLQPPEWERAAHGVDAAARDSSYQGEVPGAGVPGGGAESVPGRAGGAAAAGDQALGEFEQPGFHGTGNIEPYDQFDINKVGGEGGEGSQNEGHGIYITGSKGAGEFYRQQNSAMARGAPVPYIDGKSVVELVDDLFPHPEEPAEVEAAYARVKALNRRWATQGDAFKETPEEREQEKRDQPIIDAWMEKTSRNQYAREALQRALWSATDNKEGMQGVFERLAEAKRNAVEDFAGTRRPQRDVQAGIEDAIQAMVKLDEKDPTFEMRQPGGLGRLYHVEIPDEGYLMWRESIKDQPEAIQDALDTVFRKLTGSAKDTTALDWWEKHGMEARGRDVYNRLTHALGGVKAVSEALYEHGIVGTKYRGNEDEGPYFNHVLFHHDDIKIVSYEQPGKDAPRARIFLGKDQTVVSLFSGRDKSSFMHETGHFLLAALHEFAGRADAPVELKADLQTVRQWLGVKDGEQLTRAQHEQFAEGWETYLMKGQAPSRGLRDVFRRFAKWLTDLYQSITNREGLPEAVTQVMDRLVATQAEIRDAAQEESPPLFDDQASFNGDEKAYVEYTDTILRAKQRAVDILEGEMMQRIRDEERKDYDAEKAKVREDVGRMVDLLPPFRALGILRGKWPQAMKHLDDGQPLRLSRREIVDNYGEDALAQLPGPQREGEGPRPNRGATIYSDGENQVALIEVARLTGFSSGDALFRALVGAPDRDELIDSETTKEMDRRRPDPFNDGSARERARLALANKDRLKAMVMEAEALATRTGTMPTPSQLLQAVAQREIDATAAFRLSPEVHRVAMHQAGKAAAAAMVESKRATDPVLKKRYLEEAQANKTREILSYHLYRISSLAKEAEARGAEYLATFDKIDKRERLGKAGGNAWVVRSEDPVTHQATTREFATQAEAVAHAKTIPDAEVERSGFLEQILGLMEQVNLRRPSNAELRRRESLRDFIARKSDDGDALVVSGDLASDLGNRNWRELTVQQQRDLVNGVRNLEKQANQQNRLLTEGRRATLDEEVQVAVDTIKTNKPKVIQRGVGGGILDAPLDAFGRYLAAQRKVASILYVADGFTHGHLFDIWQRRLNRAFNDELKMVETTTASWAELLKQWGKIRVGNPLALNWKKLEPSVGVEMNHWAKIMVALNWGNAGNRERLLKGYGWKEEQVEGLIDTLDKHDMDFVQGTLDLVNSFWTDIKAKVERVTGIAPEKVESLPIITRHGVYRGGYFPAKYDPRTLKGKDPELDEQASIVKMGERLWSTTRRGHTEARTDAPDGARIWLVPSVVSQHLNQVVHDLAFHEPLIDLNRLLRHDDFREAVQSHLGDHAFQQMKTQLRDVAGGVRGSETGLDKLLEYTRQGTMFASRAFNLVTALQQAAGIPAAIVRVGPKYYAKGLVRMFSDGASLDNGVRFAEHKSIALRTRGKTFDKNLADATLGVGLRGPLRRAIDGAGYYAWTKAFQILDSHTWLSAYMKALDEDPTNDARAVDIADQTVTDVQGSGAAKDLPAIMRGGPLAQVFTSQMSWWLSNYNLTVESLQRAKSGKIADVARTGAELFVLYGVMTATWAGLDAALTGRDAEAWKDPLALAKKLGSDAAYTAASNMVLVHDLADSIAEGKKFEGPGGLRAMKLFADTIAAGWQVYKDHDAEAADEGARDKLLHSGLRSAGVLFHLPSKMLLQIMDAVNGRDEAGASPFSAALFGKPAPAAK